MLKWKWQLKYKALAIWLWLLSWRPDLEDSQKNHHLIYTVYKNNCIQNSGSEWHQIDKHNQVVVVTWLFKLSSVLSAEPIIDNDRLSCSVSHSSFRLLFNNHLLQQFECVVHVGITGITILDRVDCHITITSSDQIFFVFCFVLFLWL